MFRAVNSIIISKIVIEINFGYFYYAYLLSTLVLLSFIHIYFLYIYIICIHFASLLNHKIWNVCCFYRFFCCFAKIILNLVKFYTMHIHTYIYHLYVQIYIANDLSLMEVEKLSQSQRRQRRQRQQQCTNQSKQAVKQLTNRKVCCWIYLLLFRFILFAAIVALFFSALRQTAFATFMHTHTHTYALYISFKYLYIRM